MLNDPSNPLTDEQLEELGKEDFDSFLEYLDGQSAELLKKARPLNSYELKRMSSITAAEQNKQLSEEEFQKIKKLGKKNESQILNKNKDGRN